MKNILFLCTHNSCRSVMAEGLMQHYGKGKFTAYSAGSFPSGNINLKAIQILKKNKIKADYDNFKSQSWDDFENIKMDIVITVCDSAAGETCPLFLGGSVKANWGVFDPSQTKGSEAEIEISFQDAFEILQKRILALVDLDLNNFTKDELKQELDKIGKLI
ncbi:MAG: arsenate reductase ArsC [Rickettsiales bacterium]|nr:arsenate reductase ArsC [Rickettsiales bacterium]